MLTEIYIEALLVDKERADQVWEAWDADQIDEFAACTAWRIIGLTKFRAPLQKYSDCFE